MAKATVHHCCFRHHRLLRGSFLCEPYKRFGIAYLLVPHFHQESVCARHNFAEHKLVHAIGNNGCSSWTQRPWRVGRATVGLGGPCAPGNYVINLLSFFNKKFYAICGAVFWHCRKPVSLCRWFWGESLLLAAKNGVHCCVSGGNSLSGFRLPPLTLQESKYDSCSTFLQPHHFFKTYRRNILWQKHI